LNIREPMNTLVLSPAYKHIEPGDNAPYDIGGECVFYQHGLCEIYPVRPYECTKYYHNNSIQENIDVLIEVVDSWVENQDRIFSLRDHKQE